jgi:hypothetical protein
LRKRVRLPSKYLRLIVTELENGRFAPILLI